MDPKLKAKRCKACGETKPPDDFYRHPQGRDGLFARCKLCVKSAGQEWRRKNKRRHAETMARWQRENRDKAREIEVRTREKYPEKTAARRALNEAVRHGRLEKPDACKSCDKEFTSKQLQGHHHDYSKPLDVEWLCKGCHDAAHERGVTHAN